MLLSKTVQKLVDAWEVRRGYLFSRISQKSQKYFCRRNKKNEIVCVCVYICSIFFSLTIFLMTKHYFSGYMHILGCPTVELMSTGLDHQVPPNKIYLSSRIKTAFIWKTILVGTIFCKAYLGRDGNSSPN